jgi:Tol biopolymer transport system component
MRQKSKLDIHKRILLAFFVSYFGLFILFTYLSAQQTAGEMFQEALFLEEAEGDLEKAIELYQKILDQFPEERQVAVKAQLHIGLCYEKLGLKEAREAFEKVIANFPDQEEEVKIARQKLARLVKAKAVIEDKKTELSMQKVFTGVNQDFEGAPSPDGRYLSTVDWETGDLAIKEIPSGQMQRLTHKHNWVESQEYALVSVWSPDGKKLAYSWMNEDRFFELRVIGLDGSEPQVLYRNKENFYVQPFDWSPDGRYILAGLGKGQRITQITTISVKNGTARILKRHQVNTGLKDDVFTPGFYLPDGKTIIFGFVAEIPGSRGSDIALLPAEGGEQVILVEHPAHDVPLVWDSHSERLLFMSDRTGNMDVWALEMKQGSPQGKPYLLKKDIGRIRVLGFTDNEDLYYLQYAGMNDVYTATLDPKTDSLSTSSERVTKLFVGANRSPDFSPDGESLAYISDRSYGPGRFTTPVICIQSLESGEMRELVTELDRIYFIRWSADKKNFYSHGFDKRGRTGLFSIDIQTGELDLLLGCREEEYIPELDVLPDGKKIVYKMWEQRKSGEGHIMSIRIRDIESEKEEEIYRNENASQTDYVALSSDSQWIAFDDRVRLWTLKVIPVTGGEAEELYRMKFGESIHSLAWRPGSKEIFFVKGAELNQLWRVDLEDKEPQRMDFSMKSLSGLCFHPDGKRIAFHAGYVEVEVWVMENLLRLERKEKIFKQ